MPLNIELETKILIRVTISRITDHYDLILNERIYVQTILLLLASLSRTEFAQHQFDFLLPLIVKHIS